MTYDYGSVMHYSQDAFARRENLPVLVAKEAYNQNTMGQRIGPSFSDVFVMNQYYKCYGKNSPSIFFCYYFTFDCFSNFVKKHRLSNALTEAFPTRSSATHAFVRGALAECNVLSGKTTTRAVRMSR